MNKSIHVFFICLIFPILCTCCNLGCRSFDPISLDGQPDECSDFYTVLNYYSVEGKDAAFIGTVYNECKIARINKYKNKIESLCKKIYYPDKAIDKKDYELYSQYLECIK